jgi:glycine cleavage system aminomethyltransferase T
LRDGKVTGFLSSGAYGHTLGGAVGLGYVPCAGQSREDVLLSRYQIEIAGTLVAATASLKPMYDPASTRVKL